MANERLGLCIRLNRRAVSQFAGLGFNSFCELDDGTLLAASSDGISTLGGNDDAGAAINAVVQSPTIDMGSSQIKRIRKLALGYETDGGLIVTLRADDGTRRAYRLGAIYGARRQSGNSVPGVRDQAGRYFALRIENDNGSFFSIDTIDALLVSLGRRKTKWNASVMSGGDMLVPMATVSGEGAV